jgi:hypothetical protein
MTLGVGDVRQKHNWLCIHYAPIAYSKAWSCLPTLQIILCRTKATLLRSSMAHSNRCVTRATQVASKAKNIMGSARLSVSMVSLLISVIRSTVQPKLARLVGSGNHGGRGRVIPLKRGASPNRAATRKWLAVLLGIRCGKSKRKTPCV